MVGLNPVVGQSNVGGVGEDAHPQSSRETARDVAIVVSLPEEDQVWCVGAGLCGQGRSDRSRRQAIADVDLDYRACTVITQDFRCVVVRLAQKQCSDIAHCSGFGEQFEPQR